MTSANDNLLSRRQLLARAAVGAVTATGVLGNGWLARLGTGAEQVPCLRPPGALDEDDFLATCIRCGRCADACPNRSIVAFTDDSGREMSVAPGFAQRNTPVIFPRRQACILCTGAPGEHLLCTEACPTGALRLTRKDPATLRAEVAMGTAEVDTNLCYSFNGASCGVCVRACPLAGEALTAGLWEKPSVDASTCVGCGLCERSCVRYPAAIRVRPSTRRTRV